MKILYAFMFAVLVSGCSFLHFVDAKGRDCTENTVLLLRWSECNDNKEPLATQKQEITIDAKVNAIK